MRVEIGDSRRLFRLGLVLAVLAAAALGLAQTSRAVTLVPPPPTREYIAQQKECHDFKVDTTPLAVSVQAAPKGRASGSLIEGWRVTVAAPGVDLGQLAGLVYQWDSKVLIGVTSNRYWLWLPLTDAGERDLSRPAYAAPIRGLDDTPLGAANGDQGTDRVSLATARGIVRYETVGCRAAAPAEPGLRFDPQTRFVRFAAWDTPATMKVLLDGPEGPLAAATDYYEPAANRVLRPAADLPATLLSPDLIAQLAYELAPGCDLVTFRRNPRRAGETIVETSCSPGFLARLKAAEKTASRRSRTPPPERHPRAAGVIDAPVRAAAFADLPFNTPIVPWRRDYPGRPAWLYVAGDTGSAIEIIGYHVRGASFLRHPGGVDPPPPDP